MSGVALVALESDGPEYVTVYIPERYAQGDGTEGALYVLSEGVGRVKVADLGTIRRAGYTGIVSLAPGRSAHLTYAPTSAADPYTMAGAFTSTRTGPDKA